MTPRPYISLKIEALEALFTRNRSNAEILGRISAELAHRQSQRASNLKVKVDSASDQLKRQPKFNDKHSDRVDVSKGLNPGASDRVIEGDQSTMTDPAERKRLSALYEQLRLKLLDLSRRNRMLNYSLGQSSKRHLQIVDEVLEETYRQLTDEETSLRIAFLAEPDDIPADEKSEDFLSALAHAKVSNVDYLSKLATLESEGKDDELALAKLDRELRDNVRASLGLPLRRSRKEINRAEHARSLDIDPNFELPPKRTKKAHQDRALQSLKYPDELEAVMRKISDDARLAEQEMGVSTLFLAFGFLEWYEADESDKKSFAPLLLLPVELERQKVRGKDTFTLSARDSAAEANLSLRKLLEKSFNRHLPDFQLDHDEGAGSIEAYLELTRASIEGLKRWQIHRWLVLGHFAFGRFVIYSDLKPENWRRHPTETPLVGAVLKGSEGSSDGRLIPTIPDDYPIDDPEIEKVAPLLIQDADASQHSALIDVVRGQNLVIQGPPGTGKSQTITNIIANALTLGKKVLFLAEKQAALDVVYRRLEKSGLGDFCLELHSDKASPRRVIEKLKQRADLGWGKNSRHVARADDLGWLEAKRVLSGYLRALHAERTDGSTPFINIWKALHGRSRNADVLGDFSAFKLPSHLLDDPDLLDEVRARLSVFADAASIFEEAFGHPSQSPWTKISTSAISGVEITQLITNLASLETVALKLNLYLEKYGNFLGTASVSVLKDTLAVDESLSEPPDGRVIAQVALFDLEALSNGLQIRRLLIEAEDRLSNEQDLSHEDSKRLSIAVHLCRRLIPDALHEKAPRTAYNIANKAIQDCSAFAAASRALNPVLTQLGLGTELDASALRAIAIAPILAAGIGTEHHVWVHRAADLEEAPFATGYDQWRMIRAAEGEWRVKLHIHGDLPWPNSLEIQSALKVLRKTGVVGAVGAMTGKTRAAMRFATTLGLQGTKLAVCEALDRLANHVDALAAFNSDVLLEKALGSQWNGYSTQFEELSRGVKLRAEVRHKLSQVPYGDEVAEKFLALSPIELGAIAGQSAAGQHFLTLRDPREHQAGNTSISQFISFLDNRVRDMQAFLADDPKQSLVGIDLPIAEIAKIAGFLAEKSSLEKALQQNPLLYAINELGRSLTDIASVKEVIAWVSDVRRLIVPHSVKEALLSSNASSARNNLRGAAFDGNPILRDFAKLIGQVRDIIDVSDLRNSEPKALIEQCQIFLSHQNELPDYLAVLRLRKDLASRGIEEILSWADRLAVPPKRLADLFEVVISALLVARARPANSPLATAAGVTLEAQRRTFAIRDRGKIQRDRETVRAELLRNVPPAGSDTGPKATWTEMSLLRNEFAKQKRLVPVRSLLSRAGVSVQTMKPCFMMSPLSLAKFLEPERLKFDLLVIDEASQMKPEDALGGLLRATQVIVVGDPKQLPPTDFFNRWDDSSSQDEEFEDIDDESILEACQKTFRSVRRLKWHYRSRCESLIAFSNAEFYERSLVTFPMARPNFFSVDLISVAGNYQASRNVAEASRVAEEAVRFMRHFAESDEATVPTLGIATVNVAQRDLIQEELRLLAGGDELVERYRGKVANRGEPVFIKNLENVQGDERDFIFISLTYGREPGAKSMRQRFGPINGQHGHRRLNVLFTRARIRLCLFSSFQSSDIRPSETSSPGVHVLKRYLEYAENRGRAPVERIGAVADSEFELEVAERLRRHGYDVDLQVGVSGFRIDIGIRDPDHHERFLAGIECDGARYHSSGSARDRDRLREEVLKELGWEIFRVWSTDWFDNADLETAKLIKRVEQLRGQERRQFVDYGVISDPSPSEDLSSQEHESYVDAAGTSDVGTVVDVPSIPTEQTAQTDQELLLSREPLTAEQATKLLAFFRNSVIQKEMTDWEPQRSILRESMIETFVQQRITEPDDWFLMVPQYQRSATNPVEKQKYLARICEIIDRVE